MVLFRSGINYFSDNTDYRIKVARLQSEGVFKDIPTLQTSDTKTSPAPYDTFISQGRYGFSAIADGTANCRASTADEIPLVNAGKYLVEFNLKLNSGTAPLTRFRLTDSGTIVSNVIQTSAGRNSLIYTATATNVTTLLQFYNNSTATDYEISGLTIRRIYDADTFAAFIKGGDFGDNYTLVDTAGGSGSNPVTDSTYKTSEYFVADLDQGDKFGNLIMHSQVPQ